VGRREAQNMGMSPEVLANMYKWVDAQSFILEEEIIKAQADQMSRSIDYQLLVDNMVNQGWTEVIMEPWFKANHSVTSWCERNVKGAWSNNVNRFLFEDIDDANWFKLRWWGE